MVGFSARSVQRWEISEHVVFPVNLCCCGFIVIKISCYPSVMIPCIKQAIEFQPAMSALSSHLPSGAKHILSEQTVGMETLISPLYPLTQVSWQDIQNLSTGFQDLSIKGKSSGTVHSLQLNETEVGFCRHTEVSMEIGVLDEGRCHARLWIRTKKQHNPYTLIRNLCLLSVHEWRIQKEFTLEEGSKRKDKQKPSF